jgi:mono/diheme cytochrome c family protein
MQPLTFAITLPSAISLYSLSATIWRSNMQWTVPAKFLAAAMLSWIIAGLQGVVNATIVFNEVIHNTMWIVGHFHNMALLNIGLVIFAAIYAFLPRLTGRQWYSESLGNAHLWLTFIGGYGMSILLLIQGLDGAPRRYAVLPEQYDTITQLTVPFVLMTALGQVVFGYNLVQSLRGKTQQDKDSVLRSFGLTASLIAAAAVIGGSAVVVHNQNAGETPAAPGLAQGGGAAGGAQAAAGQAIFVEKCGACHTLSEAGTSGRVGPSLDAKPYEAAAVLAAIRNGGLGSGTMPKDIVVGEEAQQVADYVAENAGP